MTAPSSPAATDAATATATGTAPGVVVGILVGGASRRMGGAPKGLLDAGGGESIVARSVRLVRALGLDVMLVGGGAAYDALGADRLPDAAVDAGPLAGLVALLAHGGGADAITLACDLPRWPSAVVARLAALPAGSTCAPRVDGRWQPLAARWSSTLRPEAERRLREGPRALHALLDAVHAEILALTPDEAAALADWDTPEDVRRR